LFDFALHIFRINQKIPPELKSLRQKFHWRIFLFFTWWRIHIPLKMKIPKIWRRMFQNPWKFRPRR